MWAVVRMGKWMQATIFTGTEEECNALLDRIERDPRSFTLPRSFYALASA